MDCAYVLHDSAYSQQTQSLIFIFIFVSQLNRVTCSNTEGKDVGQLKHNDRVQRSLLLAST